MPHATSVDDDFDPFAGPVVERVTSSSEAQREVWLADRLSPQASLAYNESCSLDMRGHCQLTALQAALDQLLVRHGSLRSCFSPDGTQMLRNAASPVNLAQVDARGGDAEQAAHRLHQVQDQAVRTPFDLERGPLFRATLVRLSDSHAVLVMTAHHIVCDGWSWGLISQDLGELYNEQLGSGPAPAPADDYADYLRWEAVEASGAARDGHERYWLSRFQGSSLPVLDLPLDRPRAPQRSFNADRIDHELPAHLVQQVKAVGAQRGLSLFATLLASFATLLHRVSGQDDLVVGVPAAGQSASGLQALVGHCVNLLPVRLDPQTEESFSAFAQRASAHLLDAFDHQALTYGALLQQLPVQRDPSRLPLVSVMFNLDQAVQAELHHFEGLAVTLSANPRCYENFELFLNLSGLGDGRLRLECQYNTDLLDADSVARWLRCYETLLAQVAQRPDAPLGQLALLAPSDAQVLRQWQPPATPLPEPATMHAAVLRQCQATPERLAVRAGSQSLSYRALDERANQLARSLRGRGIRRGDLVGLCLNRHADMLVALLAVLKAGAAYVPLDPGFPPSRLAFYAQDAQLALLITESDLAVAPRTWRDDAADRLLLLDQDRHWLSESVKPLAPSADDAGPEDIAYIIYTSGSTGQPKGVQLPHRAVANFLAAMQVQPGLQADDRLAAVTTLSFDIAVLELLLPLSVGATVVLVPRDTTRDARELLALLAAEAITVMQATPSLFRMLLEAGWQGAPGFKVLIGGEGLPRDLATELLARADQVWNMYGPTETTVWSTAWRVDAAVMAHSGVSIGRPIANTSVWVLDTAGQPCPVGVPGELVIGGEGVALGYHQRAALTAERFVPDPFSATSGARLYRTGDRGRWRNDGLIEHLGRLDFQVKLRGFRIELGEIEAACRAFSGVADSVAVVREDRPGDPRLVAYLVVAGGRQLDERALRDFLRGRLPDYMLPQHMVVLPQLPQLPNGKIDRKALPAPQAANPQPTAGEAAQAAAVRVPPRNEAERQVLEAMEQVLKLPGLGVHDDFFAMGGHSLLAARLATQLSQGLGRRVPLSLIFEWPTAAKLAQALHRPNGEAAAAVLATAEPSFQHDAARTWAPLTPMQERVRLVQTIEPDSTVYNTPSGHVLTGPLDLPAFRRAFVKMVARQSAFRTVIVRRGTEEPVQQVLPMDALDWGGWPYVDLSAQPRALQSSVLMAAIRDIVDSPMDITQAPLFRATLYRLSEKEHVFLFMPHHLIWDGWSFDVMYAEMAALYAAELSEQPSVLPPPPLSHLDHAVGVCTWLGSAAAASQLAYWRERFAALPQPQGLPTDLARRPGMVGEGLAIPLHVDAALTHRLRERARVLGVTLSMLTMGVYAAMLAAVAQSPAVVLGLPVRGRNGPELERTVGFFINLLPLPVMLPPQATAEGALQQLRSDLAAALGHQTIPFPLLAGQPEIQAKATPAGIYQAAFSFQDARERPQNWGPLSHARLTVAQKGVTEETGLWLVDLGEQIEGSLTYNSEVFSAATATALGGWYLELLARAADPEQRHIADWTDTPDSPHARHLLALAGRATQSGALASPSQPGAPAVRGISSLTPAERALAQLWARLLGIDSAHIRATDNFFDLGGDSLMAMRAVEAGMVELGLSVNGRRYIYETLAQIAATPAATPSGGPTDAVAAQAGQGSPAAPSASDPAANKPGFLGRWFGGGGRRGSA